MKQNYQAYSAATQTVSKTRQIVLLYDGAIRFLQQARAAMTDNRIEERYKLLTKTSEIISGLQTSLDHAQGGHIARLLHNFYSSIDARIFSLHRSNNTAVCDVVIQELKQMRDAWDEIDRDSSGHNVSASRNAMIEPPSDQGIILSA